MHSLHRNHQAFWRHMARVCGGTVQEIPGGLIVSTGIRAAPYNQVHCRADANDAEVIDQASAYFAERALSWRIVCERPSPDAELFGKRHGRGREPLYPILRVATEQSRPPARGPALAVTAAGDVADLRAFVDCAAAS